MTEQASNPRIVMVGAGCRLPGASGLDAFWRLLMEGRNTVQDGPVGRWSVERFLRPGNPSPGFAYTFAGGYLDDPLGFDPTPFGISPREAQQMDPQQRVLLEVVWDAFEDAGIPPSSLTGREVGVYIGASMVDYQSGASHDPAVMESHFMTGNSLSILSNRISYIYNFQGPSFTVDSACSSSFVALDRAVAALRAGEIDTAVVGGVNLCLSPAPFIGFSQARMLSPTGRSRPFSADGDGYVRSEGAVVLVLRREDLARAEGNRLRAEIVDVAINSDGRTSGISLPSIEGQRRLLDKVYDRISVSADDIAFVEAHGTGTKVGDPIEAAAIGGAIGQRRVRPLPIGSVKSNIGHLEAASGLAGLLKSALALQNRVLPKSLFLENPNDAIDFAGLNLAPNGNALALDLEIDGTYAAICNYGFGGTNAHALIRAVEQEAQAAVGPEITPAMLMISAASKESLQMLAGHLAAADDEAASLGAAAREFAYFRDIQKYRIAVPLADNAQAKAVLAGYAGGDVNAAIMVSGEASENLPLALVFSGNGAQYTEMGQAAYRGSASFRNEIAEIDTVFVPLAGWSIAERLNSGIAPDLLAQTSIAQPLIYAIQSALAADLLAQGFKPEVVLGHSVGEVAAAEAAGILTRADAVRLIYLRSQHQEKVRRLGSMMVIATDRTQVETLIAGFGDKGLEIAASNSPTSTTISGPRDALKLFAKHCRLQRIATVPLDIDYPFHSSMLAPFEAEMIADLRFLRPRKGHCRFVSGVTGADIDGAALDANYWWQNIRSEVRFSDAVASAAAGAQKLWLELSPRAILAGPVSENLKALGLSGEVLPSLTQKDGTGAVTLVAGRLMVNGVAFSREIMFGPRPVSRAEVPGYPFSRQDYALPATAEAFNAYGKTMQSAVRHPLLGARMADGSPEWRALIDPQLVPYLDDHRVDGGVIVPAAGLIEMGLAAGRDLFGTVPLELDEFDVLKALAIAEDETREVSVRYASATATIEIWSRKRFSAQEWALHARGVISPLHRPETAPLPPPIEAQKVADTAVEVYEEATLAGLNYGPLFQLVTSSERDPVTTDSQLAAAIGGLGAFEELHVLSPISLDAAFHGLFISRPQKEGEKKAHLPVRFRKICVWRHGVSIRRAITLLTHETDRFKTVAITLLDAENKVVASVEAAVLKALYLSKATVADRTFRLEALPLARTDAATVALAAAAKVNAPSDENVPAPWLVARAFGVALAHRVLLRGLNPADTPAAKALHQTANRIVEAFGLMPNGRLQDETGLPSADELLATLSRHFPDANLEIRLAASALAQLESVIQSGKTLAPPVWLRDQISQQGVLTEPVLSAIVARLVAASNGLNHRLRVLIAHPWHSGLIARLSPLSQAGRVEITLAAPSRKAIAEARAMLRLDQDIEFLDLSAPEGQRPAIPYDALISGSSAAFAEAGLPEEMIRHLRTDSLVLVGNPGLDATFDFLAGIWNGWLAPVAKSEGSLERPAGREAVKAALEHSGVNALEIEMMPDGMGALLIGKAPIADTQVPKSSEFAVMGSGALFVDLVANARGSLLLPAAKDGVHAWLESQRDAAHILYLVESTADAVETLAREIEAIKAIAESFEDTDNSPRISIVTSGALEEAGSPDAVASGLWGFLRVAINEYPKVDFRLIDLNPELDVSASVTRLNEAMALDGGELELSANAAGLSALRMRRGLHHMEPLADHERAVLRFEQPGRLDSFHWVKAPRKAPGAGEVEIDVAAVGLNYRDVLVGLGILDDDLLGAGLTAAALGFECSGVVTRIGAGVTDLAVGDRVMGFAANTFTSHLVAPDWHFHKVPDGLSLEAAATVPVAFATAWFALITRARLGKGEDVLIHGGAGGVGLAAIQIAKEAGARVLATASTPERRQLAKTYGADLTYDSRNERFAEAIRDAHGGVDVVLNSLAGAAMAASFKLVKAFGRFLELGKRDYLENTHLGLRPFVRNIAYFGIDLDELLAHDRALVGSIMGEISARMADGRFAALPHRIYAAHEIGTAFHAMQASEHIGKLVVVPPKEAIADITALKPQLSKGACLVIGGTSGLGLSTARWLAKRGAGTVVLASRRGMVEEGGEAQLNAIRALGAEVVIESLDVNNAKAVKTLVDRIAKQHGGLAGIVHAAVLLEDGMISGLQPDRLRAVLATKVRGAENLVAAAKAHKPEFIVFYSSATTVIGSPGQGAYVAANAWLEGYARALRLKGVPALAIGWGAISDVGIIARDKQLGRRLRRTTGVVGISSSESLAHLGRMLVLGKRESATQFYTNIAPSAAAEKLRLINSPAFAGLGLARSEDKGEDGGDLVTAIEGRSEPEAIGIIVRALRREISYILRMPEEQIDTSRPLAELGLDSLMALELQLAIERLCGMEVPMVGSADRRLGDIAAGLYSKIGTPGAMEEESTADLAGTSALAQSMASMHGAGALSAEAAAALSSDLAKKQGGQ